MQDLANDNNQAVAMPYRMGRKLGPSNGPFLLILNPANAGLIIAAALSLLLASSRVESSQQPSDDAAHRPQLRKLGNVTQLLVDGKPFLVLGGELGNSTASDIAVLEKALDRCQQMKLNTVMLPVYWDLVEPEEGKFDFTLVKGAIDRARDRNLRIVYLWFGTWKNSMSCYAPSWVKRDTKRFERVRRSTGETEEIISPASTAASAADARAFAALMRWTREYDSSKHTIIMVQVENEVGMIPEPRDHSEKSETAYRSDVPEGLMARAAKRELGPEVNALWWASPL